MDVANVNTAPARDRQAERRRGASLVTVIADLGQRCDGRGSAAPVASMALTALAARLGHEYCVYFTVNLLGA